MDRATLRTAHTAGNTLIVNLTRFGDLLQTQPVISGLTQAGHQVGIVCLDNFAGATALLRDVAAVYPLTGGSLLTTLDADWRQALGAVWQWAEQVHDGFAPQQVLNLTATLSVRLLASHLARHETSSDDNTVRGFGLDAFGFSVNSDAWSTFLQASTRLRGCSPFNLVDLYWMAAGLGEGERVYALREPQPDHLLTARALLEAEAHTDCRGYVAMQLGASEDRRRWPVAHFAELGDRLWREEKLMPVLLGATGEAHLAERYGELATQPFRSLVGATTLPVLAAVLRQARLLVTNDTGTMHLAAGLHVPILAVFLATAQPWDTGPYRAGSCSLEPDLPCHPCPFGTACPNELACRHKIPASTLYELIRHWLQHDEWAAPAVEHGARIWLARHGENGFMDLASLSGHEDADRTRWVRQQRFFYSQFLDRAPAARLASSGVRPVLPPPWAAILHGEQRTTALFHLEQALQLLHLFGEQGRMLSMRPTDTAKQRFLGTWQRLQTLWDSSALFNVLGHMWMCESQEAGNDLATVLLLASQYQGLLQTWRASIAAADRAA